MMKWFVLLPVAAVMAASVALATNPTRLDRVVMYADEIRIGNGTATCNDVKPSGSATCEP